MMLSGGSEFGAEGCDGAGDRGWSEFSYLSVSYLGAKPR
jgi:hypothetical protein